ncbi:MAG TPA: helix-hairpin-helix domain-containing protein [Catenuloplanes sp.]|jgi:competence protein ComEA
MQEVESRDAELVRDRLSRLLPVADPGRTDTARHPGRAPGPAGAPAESGPIDRDGLPGPVGRERLLDPVSRVGAPGPVGRERLSGAVGAQEGSGAPGVSGLAGAGGVSRPGVERGAAGRLSGAGAFDPGRRGVRALAAVAVLVVIAAALLAWRSRPRSEPVPAVPIAAVPVPSATSAGTAPGAGAATEVVVTVAGKVRRAGLVRLPAGARVGDALAAAGGVLPGVDAALLNPARKIADGELILVGVTAPAGAPGPPGAPGAPAAQPGGRVSLNTATLAQLDTLPGVGPVLAQRILAHRDAQGGFRSVADLRQVEGIGQARYEQLKDLVSL